MWRRREAPEAETKESRNLKKKKKKEMIAEIRRRAKAMKSNGVGTVGHVEAGDQDEIVDVVTVEPSPNGSKRRGRRSSKRPRTSHVDRSPRPKRPRPLTVDAVYGLDPELDQTEQQRADVSNDWNNVDNDAGIQLLELDDPSVGQESGYLALLKLTFDQRARSLATVDCDSAEAFLGLEYSFRTHQRVSDTICFFDDSGVSRISTRGSRNYFFGDLFLGHRFQNLSTTAKK